MSSMMQSRATMARVTLTARYAVRYAPRSAWVCGPSQIDARKLHSTKTSFVPLFGTMRPVEAVDGRVRAATLAWNGWTRGISHSSVSHSREEKPITATDIQEELQQRGGGIREEKNLEEGLPKFDFSKAPPTLPPKGTEHSTDNLQRSELLNAAFEANFGTSTPVPEQESPAAEQASESALPKFNFADAAPTTTQYTNQNTRSSLLNAAMQANYGSETEEQQSPVADQQEGGLPKFQYSQADSSPQSAPAGGDEWDYSPEAAMKRFIEAQNPEGERGVPDYEVGQRELDERIEAAQAKSTPAAPRPAALDAFASALLRVGRLEDAGWLSAEQAAELRWLCLWEEAPMRVLQQAYPGEEEDPHFVSLSVSLLEQMSSGKLPPSAKRG